MEVRLSSFIKTGRGAHAASYTIGAGFVSWGKFGQGVVLTTHQQLAKKKKGKDFPLQAWRGPWGSTRLRLQNF